MIDKIMGTLDDVVATKGISFFEIFAEFMTDWGGDGSYDDACKSALKGLSKTEKDIFHVYFDYRESVDEIKDDDIARVSRYINSRKNKLVNDYLLSCGFDIKMNTKQVNELQKLLKFR